jgi:hypothetical protein
MVEELDNDESIEAITPYVIEALPRESSSSV